MQNMPFYLILIFVIFLSACQNSEEVNQLKAQIKQLETDKKALAAEKEKLAIETQKLLEAKNNKKISSKKVGSKRKGKTLPPCTEEEETAEEELNDSFYNLERNLNYLESTINNIDPKINTDFPSMKELIKDINWDVSNIKNFAYLDPPCH